MKFITRNKILLLIILNIFLASSCKVDEFKLNELGIKEEWNSEIVGPLFHGNMEFRDFITDWNHFDDQSIPDEPQTTLKYMNDFYRVIPTRLIFEPSVVIDSFPLIIQGKYEMKSISLEFDITNASPYPLNLELQFYNELDTLKAGPKVVPETFAAGNINGNTVDPVQTIQYVDFNPAQLQSFNLGNRVRFISWYDRNSYIKDTLSAHYPIEVSIILWGEIKGKNEN